MAVSSPSCESSEGNAERSGAVHQEVLNGTKGVEKIFALKVLSLGVGDRWVTGSKVRRWHTAFSEEGHIGPAKLGPHLKLIPLNQRGNHGIAESGTSGR